MSNKNKYIPLPGGKECKPVNPHTKDMWQYLEFERNNPPIPITEVMPEGEEFSGSEVFQYEHLGEWYTCDENVITQQFAPVRYAIKPLVNVEKRVEQAAQQLTDIKFPDAHNYLHSQPFWYKQGCIDALKLQQSNSIEGIVGFVFSDGEDKANITDLHLLSDIYDMIQNRLKSFSENTIERLSKPLRDLLLHNGVNVDDETEF